MNIIGKTIDGKEIVSDIGHVYFQEGLPLVFIFDILQKNNMIPGWLHLYKELKDNGMSHKRIIHLLSENLFESYGTSFRNTVLEKLSRIISSIG